MKAQFEFWRYKNGITHEEGEAMEEKGIDLEKESFFDEGHFKLELVSSFWKNNEQNIRINLSSGEVFTLLYEDHIWDALVNHFEGTISVDTGTTADKTGYLVSFDGLEIEMTKEEYEEFNAIQRSKLPQDAELLWKKKIDEWQEKTGYKYFR